MPPTNNYPNTNPGNLANPSNDLQESVTSMPVVPEQLIDPRTNKPVVSHASNPQWRPNKAMLWTGMAILLATTLAILLILLVSVSRNNAAKDLDKQTYPNTNIPLTDLTVGDPLTLGQIGNLDVNGTVSVNGSLVLAPTATPDILRQGQLFTDKATNRLSYYDGSAVKGLATTGEGISSITGRRNQVTATTTGTNVALSLPQDISANSIPEFLGLTLKNALSIINGGTGATTAEQARKNLGAAAIGDIPSGNFVNLGPVTPQTDSSTNSTIYINKTNTGNILKLQSNATNVVTVTNTGATTLQNATDSTNAFKIQNAAGTDMFAVNTLNGTVSITGASVLPGAITTWGGTGSDWANSIIQTSDGGYAVAGTTRYGAGGSDSILAKYSSTGVLEWSRTWGGTGSDWAQSLVQTTDGGYAVAGATNSYGAGNVDSFLAKYSATGTLEWSRTWGGANAEYTFTVVNAGDSGYTIAGWTQSYGTATWVLFIAKYSATGALEWSRTLNSAVDEGAYDLINTTDGGFAVTGWTSSYGAGGSDSFLAKYSATGTLEWTRSWGGTNHEWTTSIVQTTDGGYAVAGVTRSYGAGNYDSYLAKYSATGTLEWSRTWGGTNDEWTYSLVQTSDGGYAIAGETRSYGAGNADSYLAKYSSTGNLEWFRTWGGTNGEGAYDLVHTADGGFTVTGWTSSYGAGSDDIYIAKYSSSGDIVGCGIPMCQSPTPTVTSPAPTVTSPLSFTVTSPTASVSSPTPTVTSPTPTTRSIVADYSIKLTGDTYNGGNLLVKPSVNSANTFMIQNSSGLNLLTADTTNMNVVVNGTTQIDTVQANKLGLVVKGSTGQTANLVQIQNSAANNMFTVGATGQTTLKNSTDSADAFKIQNAAGSNIFAINSQNKTVSVSANTSLSGAIQTWGGAGNDIGTGVTQTTDGGYAITGYTKSFGAGSLDAFIAKYDANGTLSWFKTWGGAGGDYGERIAQTSDGGYAIIGGTASYGAGDYDAFIAKYDASGNLSWSKTWGGTGYDYGWTIAPTNDGGYTITGVTESYGAGGSDAFIAKYDASGNLSWSKTWGGTGYDESYEVTQVTDGGYVITGGTNSYGVGSYDTFIAKYDSSGNLSWSKTWGGSGFDWGVALTSTTDGGYTITGETQSYGAGGSDAFIAKYDASGNLSWSKTWGGAGIDYGYTISQTFNGGYVITGGTTSYGVGSYDTFIAKYDSSGNLSWSKTWGGAAIEGGHGLAQTADGGYIVTGSTESYGAGDTDAYIAKYDANGNIPGCPATMCQSPTATATSPTATVTSPTASVSSPTASTSSPAATVTTPAATVQNIVAGYSITMSGNTYNGGNMLVKSSTNSANSFMIQNATGNSILTIDTLNNGGSTILNTTSATAGATILSLAQSGTVQGTITVNAGTVSYNAFTGSHYASLASGQSEPAYGKLMTLAGNSTTRMNGNGELIYTVAESQTPNDPKAFGSFNGETDGGNPEQYSNGGLYLVAASGNGDLWIADNGTGNITAGDQLMSSPIPGHAMKDPGTYPTSHIVAKAAQNIDWSQVTTTDSTGTKVAKLSVFFTNYDKDNSTTILQGSNPSNTTLNIQNIDIAGNLNVNGLTTLNELKVTGNVSFEGTLTVATLTVGDITVGGHIITTGNAPKIAIGIAAGVSDPLNNISNPIVTLVGNDTAGTLTVIAGANTNSGVLAEVTFNKAFGSSPRAVLSAKNTESAKLQIFNTTHGDKLILNTVTAPVVGQKYEFDYVILQ